VGKGYAVTQKTKIISRAIAAVWIIFFITGCADSILIQKSDLSQLNQRIFLLEEQIKNQSEKTESLIELNKENRLFFSKALEQNDFHFKNMEEQISSNHGYIVKRLKTIEKTAKTNQKKEDAKNQQSDGADQKQPLKISATHKLLIGKIEKVKLNPPDRIFHARIDTGATTSSLDAQNIETFERDGNSWVRFKIKDPVEDIFYDVEKPLVRKVKIKQASTDEASRRPVIELQFQIGEIKRIEEFTLEDRSHLDFQLLIGRNVLRDLMVVDVAQEFIVPLPDEKENGNEIQ
jgi:hypothetical protein